MLSSLALAVSLYHYVYTKRLQMNTENLLATFLLLLLMEYLELLSRISTSTSWKYLSANYLTTSVDAEETFDVIL